MPRRSSFELERPGDIADLEPAVWPGGTAPVPFRKGIDDEEVHEMIYSVWLDPGVLKGDKVNHAELFRIHREATVKAIQKAMNCEPSIDWLLENQDSVEHFFHKLGVDGEL